jgi:predicted Zn-dependent peptidase
LIETVFSDEEFNKIKNFVLNEIKQQDEQIFNIGKKVMFKNVYKGYPYENLYTGTLKTVEKIKIEDIINHYKLLVNPNNSVLSMSGDYDDNQIEDILKKYFENFKSFDAAKLNEIPFTNRKVSSFEFITNINKAQTLILISFYGISVKDERMYEAEVLWNILNGQGSRFFDAIRDKKGFAYYVGMFPAYMLTTGLFVFYVGTTSEKLQTAKSELLSQIKKLSQKGVNTEELESAKKELKSSKSLERQSNMNISFNFALEELYGNKIYTAEEYNKMIDNISVEEINKFIKKYFDTNSYYIIILKGN